MSVSLCMILLEKESGARLAASARTWHKTKATPDGSTPSDVAAPPRRDPRKPRPVLNAGAGFLVLGVVLCDIWCMFGFPLHRRFKQCTLKNRL